MWSENEQRRDFLKKLGLAGLSLAGLALPAGCAVSRNISEENSLLRPSVLKKGDRIAITAPAGSVFEPERIAPFVNRLKELGFEPVLGKTLHGQHGYFSAHDNERADEINRFFADRSIKGIIAMRGGWGCARILPLLDYDTIAQNPKMIMGFSDITSLLLGIYAKTHLMTFHGPMGYSEWGDISTTHFTNILMRGETPMLTTEHQPEVPDTMVTLTPGVAKGALVGGNLTVLTSILGTPYEPEWKGKILFVEEVKEEAYRIDRMLTQLKLAGVFDKISGFVFGKCIECDPEFPEKALSFKEVLDETIGNLGIPAFYGAMIGHLREQFVLPIGARCEIDANAYTLKLLEPAVVGKSDD